MCKLKTNCWLEARFPTIHTGHFNTCATVDTGTVPAPMTEHIWTPNRWCSDQNNTVPRESWWRKRSRLWFFHMGVSRNRVALESSNINHSYTVIVMNKNNNFLGYPWIIQNRAVHLNHPMLTTLSNLYLYRDQTLTNRPTIFWSTRILRNPHLSSIICDALHRTTVETPSEAHPTFELQGHLGSVDHSSISPQKTKPTYLETILSK